jgi:CO dehydrogenase nickel-insertion accessory protein CooC1
MTHPLVIDADRIIGLDTPLGLRNREVVLGTLRHNQELSKQRKAAAAKRLEPACELAAEFIKDSASSTKTRNPDDYIRHSNIHLPHP